MPRSTSRSRARNTSDRTENRRVILELEPTEQLAHATAILSEVDSGAQQDRARQQVARSASLDALPSAELPGFSIDRHFPPTSVPLVSRPSLAAGTRAEAEDPFDVRFKSQIVSDPFRTPYLVRGVLADDVDVPELVGQGLVRAVYADAAIEPCPTTCGSHPPLGSSADVARLLSVDRLSREGMTGEGVLIAIVDTGINLAHLKSRELTPRIDEARSWEPFGTPGDPFKYNVSHGTMCAFDALIAAPHATLIDIPVLLSRRAAAPGESPVGGLLSDAILAYSHLMRVMQALSNDAQEFHSLVVSNSWGIFTPNSDLPTGHPGNYTDNLQHPFNRLVATLESLGADIMFAAGNCGSECPDGRCGWQAGQSTIAGANSHPAVLCVGGVDVTGNLVGYSSTGPGRLADRKPDVTGFTHFAGSGVWPADSGTSAACPVVAGVVAATRSRLRTVRGSGPASPSGVRDLIRKSALERGNTGFDYAYGWGIINGARLSELVPEIVDAVQTPSSIAQLQEDFEHSMHGPTK